VTIPSPACPACGKTVGHAFVAHGSMPTFTNEVVSWLASKGLGPRQP
jgi:hypothetical protein